MVTRPATTSALSTPYPSGSTHRPTQRRDAAWLLVVLWALTFVALPLLHLARHDRDHIHLPGGGVVQLGPAFHDHAHPHRPHGHRHAPHHPHGPAGATRDGPASDRPCPAPAHGAGAPEHLAVALLSVWALVVFELPSRLPEPVQPPPSAQPREAGHVPLRYPRGPPLSV